MVRKCITGIEGNLFLVMSNTMLAFKDGDDFVPVEKLFFENRIAVASLHTLSFCQEKIISVPNVM